LKIAQTISIVGLGIRGIGILERIVAYSKVQKEFNKITVYLIEKSDKAPFQYHLEQPDYLLLNIICGQVSVFPHKSSLSNCPATKGLTLYEWVCKRKLLISDDGFTVGLQGREIKPDDFLPRRILGEYLKWSLEYIENQAHSFLNIIRYRNEAVSLSLNDNHLTIKLNNKIKLDTNFLFITIGYILNKPNNNLKQKSVQKINNPYPLPNQFEKVKQKDIVAIQGLGLTFHDAILSLTIGRGGYFKFEKKKLKYFSSGKEPKIVAFSSSGLPYRSRPNLGAPLNYKPLIFNKENVDEILLNRKSKIDFDNDILPLIFTELRIAYRRAQFCKQNGWDKSHIIIKKLNTALLNKNLEANLCSLQEFNPKAIFFENLSSDNKSIVKALNSSNDYQNWIKEWIDFDLNQSIIGTLNSPLKSALEIFREFRDIIRYAIDFGNLTDKSYEKFYNIHSHTLNRIGVGPQKERLAEIIALIDSKVLQIPFGPNPDVNWNNDLKKWKITSAVLKEEISIFCDWYYTGHLNKVKKINNSPSLINSMFNKGIIKKYRANQNNTITIDVDNNYHPISIEGSVNKNIWIMGLLNEGVTFYNGYVTSPDKFVRSHYDSDKALKEIFSI